MTNQELRDQLKFAREGADNLAKRHGYSWTKWLQGKHGLTTASFEREGHRWSLSFAWTPKQELGDLAKYIEQMDYCMRVSMKEFGGLKAGEMMKRAQDAEMVH